MADDTGQISDQDRRQLERLLGGAEAGPSRSWGDGGRETV